MTNFNLKSGLAPFQISELPKGISLRQDGRLIAEPNSKGTIILRMEGDIAEPQIDLNIEAGKRSKIRIILLQNISIFSKLRLRINCKLQDRSRINFTQIHLGGSEVNAEITQITGGASAELNTYLMSLTKKKQIHIFNLTNSYNSEHGRGKILAKGVALGDSKLAINGSIYINRKGAGTDAYLKQDCLLIGRKAKIDSTPVLKIDTDNVKADHSASVSNINGESMFYLASRGISPNTARKMLITGFMAEVMDKLDDLPEVKNYVLMNI